MKKPAGRPRVQPWKQLITYCRAVGGSAAPVI
ncbi:uncharacterized protein METZ01_LOCUS349765, partial [marine metagenome]